MMRAVWITWERHRRTREITRALDIPLIEILPGSNHPWKYLSLLARTAMSLFTERPTHVFVQCPSIVLGLWVTVLKHLAGWVLVADLHNEAVEPFVCRAAWYRWLIRRLHRSADLSIITNEGLRDTVESHGGRAFVLPDRVPDFSRLGAGAPAHSHSTGRVVFVCSFAPDEPYLEVLEAASRLTDVAMIAVTGRRGTASLPEVLPPNLRLTGFLPDDAYEALLRDADAIVDLTAMENCLVCGAYEAVALERPLVTSDTTALRSFFRIGTVFTRHDPDSIAASIETALARRADLTREMRQLRAELDTAWDAQSRTLLKRLRALNGFREGAVEDLDTRWIGGRK